VNTSGGSKTQMVQGSWYNFTLQGGRNVIRVKLTFNEQYVNNAYGHESVNRAGWGSDGHSFGELLGSDGATVAFYDGPANTNGQFSGPSLLHAKFDYIGLLSGDGTHPDDYAALWLDEGIDKNDSKLGGKNKNKNDDNDDDSRQRTECVVNTDSSLAQNLRACRQFHSNANPLVSMDKSVESAASAQDLCDAWEHRVIYYVDLDPACFNNFQGGAVMSDVHASPNAGLDGFEDVTWEECVW